jgi:hypothetical protein
MQQNSSEDKDFRELMSDVRPSRRLAATASPGGPQPQVPQISSDPILVEPHGTQLHPSRRSTVFACAWGFDFLDHGLTVNGRAALYHFIVDCMKHDVRAALINGGCDGTPRC